ncbi:MAG: CopG family transcriptional regulator [Myxococcota bacterium]|nr:CopG family transcriptional regulator [Myxococcota bacterium]
MMDKQRTTIYLEAPLYRALRLKAAATGTKISALVSQAVRASLSEDFEDLKVLDERVNEPARPFEDFLSELSDANLI